MHSVGYIGLGNIGKPMCASLIKNGKDVEVFVYDVFPEPIAQMVAIGGVAAESPRAIAERCDFIGVCVRDDNDVEDLLYKQGMIDAMKRGAIIAIHSTVTRKNVLRWAKDCADRGVYLLDAGITGGAHGAEKAQLSIMVGGDEAACERARVMFDATSKLVVYCGESGSGIAVKLANNLLMYQIMVAGYEAAELVKSVGVDPERLITISNSNGVMHPQAEGFIRSREGILASGELGKHKAMFDLGYSLGYKDLAYALDLAAERGLDLSSTAQARINMAAAFFQDQA